MQELQLGLYTVYYRVALHTIEQLITETLLYSILERIYFLLAIYGIDCCYTILISYIHVTCGDSVGSVTH